MATYFDGSKYTNVNGGRRMVRGLGDGGGWCGLGRLEVVSNSLIVLCIRLRNS